MEMKENLQIHVFLKEVNAKLTGVISSEMIHLWQRL